MSSMRLVCVAENIIVCRSGKHINTRSSAFTSTGIPLPTLRERLDDAPEFVLEALLQQPVGLVHHQAGQAGEVEPLRALHTRQRDEEAANEQARAEQSALARNELIHGSVNATATTGQL